MSSLRNALRCIFFALVCTAPLSAYAVNYDVRVFFDTDSNRATGCTIPTANGPVVGVDQVLTTSVTVNGGAGTVTGVTRQVCINGLFFGDPVPVNGGWNVGVSPTGNLFIETHVGANVMTIANISTMRLAFTVTSSGGLTDAMTTDFGDDILYPVRPSRRHAVSTGALRTIHLDGIDTDWAGVETLASGDAASPALRFLDASAYADISDLFFNFRIQTNANAPTALDDFYALGTVGGTLSVSTLGVLNNDSDPNHLSLSAFLVEGPEHGTLTLNANGGFTYTHDGSSFFEDHFRYRVTNGTLESNLATVTISLPGSHPYTFTSADHVTFTAGQLNTFHVTVTGNPTPALSEDGVLPSGITFTDNGDGTGTLSGTPVAGTVGTYPIVFHAEKNKPHQTDQNFTLTVICSAITVTNPLVNTGTINTPFSQTFTQSGGAAPITWSKTGALPAGLTFNTSTGVLSGTPTQGGTFPITVTATDTSGCTGTGPTYTLTIICNSITVTNPVTTSGTVNVAFSQTFTQSGGVGTTTFSLASGTLPAGLTLNPSTGVLSGTPTQKGSFPIVVRATDSHGCAGDGPTYPLNIGCQVISVTNPATNTGTVNVAFSQTFTSGNAIAPVVFSLNSGTLPAGITLNGSTGVLSGTPTQTGSFPITVKATDANGCFGIGTTYTLTISCQTITVNNPATNTGTVNVAFSQTFTAGNAIAPVTFSLNSGTLPTGITLSSAGVLSGTPTQTGSFPITVHVVDANGCSANGATYTLTIGCQVITVNNPATNSGTVNVAFSQTFTASNAIGATTFTTASTLPTGITLSTGGVLSGTPTQTGSFPIVVHVVDANGCAGNSATYTLTINCQVITVNNPATNSGTVNVAFSQTFTASNTIGGTTFTTASTLPTGLSLSTAGVLSGTPTQSGSFPIVVTATDANGCAGNGATYNLTINCQVITVNNPVTNSGTVNAAFSQTFTASNTIGAVTFSINSGTLPAGLTLSTGGVLSGTPLQTGSFPITVKATDANGCPGIGATYTLVIGCQIISVTNPSTTTGTVNTAFSQTFTAGNTVGTVTFTTASTLPTGLSLSAGGVLSGTPTQTGSFPIVVTATDGNGCSGSGSPYTLVIGCQTITVTNPVNNSGTVNVGFSEQFTAGNTIGSVTFTTASALPAGITLSSGGLLAGTPTQAGTFPIVVTATDANGCSGNGATYNLIINCQTITVTNPANATGPAGAPFSETFTQTGGIGTITWSESGPLPTGLTFHTATGVLDGTPTQGGTFPITVTATDSNGCTGSGAVYNLNITCPTITVTNPATTTGTVNVAFSQTFTQSGGIGTTTFSESGALPAGLTFHTATGVLDGTPTQTGTFPIVVTATDANGCTGSGATYNLVIGCQVITVNNPVTNSGTANAAFSQTFTASNAIAPVTFTTASTLPTGLSLSTGGVLSGTPLQTGSFPIVVHVVDANGCSANGGTYTLVIGCQVISVTNPSTTTGTVNTAFSQTFTAGNTVGTVTFTTASTLPTGLTLSTGGVLSGTPTQKGSFPIVVTATDGNGCSGSGSTYTLVIGCQTITVTNPVNNSGTVNVGFSEQFTAGNTIGSVTFTTASALPAGITLSSGGLLAGTPTQAGTFPIVVTATDANGCSGNGATYNLIINCQTITVTNPVVNSGAAGAPFSQTFTQVGGIGTITWSESGALPTGLTFHTTTGVLDGTPSGSGAFPITVTATDSNGCTGTGPIYTLTITCPTITVTNPATTTGTEGTPFSQTFTQGGGQGTITWSLHSGSLPAGLTLHSGTGVLDGTPTVTGSFPLVLRATDSNGCTGDGPTYNLVIGCPTITVTNPVVTTGTVDTPFSQTFTQTGAFGTATFTTSSTLPPGLTLSTAGVLSGTPGAPGSFPIVVVVTDTAGCTGTNSSTPYNLNIACQTITVTKPVVTTGTVDAPFSQTFTQSGVGTHTPATFTLNSGSLPSGLTLSTAGVLSGTPGQPGSFPITVKVTDANGCTGISTTYTLNIACQTITVTNPATTTGTVAVAFSQTFTQSGVGTHTPATFTTASTLPTGFSLSAAGVLSGTTNQHGTFPIIVTVTDVNGCTGTGATYNLVISCQTITVTNPGVNTGTVGTPFSQTFTQTGANGGATFTTASALPTGITLSTAGLLSGTPLQAGSFPIVVTVTDGNGCTGTGATYTLVIACNVITVTNPGVTTGTVDAAFSQTFTQSGGNGTITWSKTGAIPAGMTFHTATGVLDGTPSVPGSFPITVTATDSNGCTGTGATYTLVIACQTITVNNPGVTTGTVDAAFSQTFTQSGVGTHTPATFTLNSGSLPSGLSLSTAGVLSGTPGQPGSFPITVKVTDANGCTGISATYTLVIACQTITVTNPLTTSGVFNAAFSQTFTQSGVGTHTPATFTINSGTLPTGLSLSTAGVLSGTPSQTGTFPITVKVTDANGCTGISATYSLAITPSLGPDSYSNLVDNTQAVVTGGATASPGTPFVTLTGSVLANDLPAGGVSVTAGSLGTTAGGTVIIASDGTFIYTPAVHAAAITTDSFTYTATSNTGATATPTSANGTVTLNLAGRVWYVKNNGGGANGQSQSPFTTLAAAAGASTANDIIFVYNGDGTNSGQNAGISLKNGQQLLGEVNGLIVNAQTLVAVGSRPTIGNSGGDGVTVAATAASLTGVFIKGFSIAGTANGINLNSSGANTLTATVDNVVITAATANNGIKIAGASTTTTTATVQNSTVSAATQNGIDAQQTSAGNLVLNINNNSVTATGIGINVNGAGSTTTTITNFATNTVTGNTGGNGISITSATFDGTPGGAFQTVSGGNTVIGSAGNGVGAAGMVLTNVAGDLSFTDLDIVSSNGAGLFASGTTPYTGSAGFQIAVASGVGTIDATNGPAADLNTVTANLPWSTIKSTNSASTGVSLVTVPGTFTTSGATSSISNATSTDFNISGGNATVTYDGTISDASGRAVSVASTTGGTKSFTGAISNVGGTGISLTSNTGATINFSGNLTLSTGSSTAFNATGGGTVTATNTSSTAVTTTGTAVNIANTTIGAGGVKFLSVSSNGAANGINLNTTGAGAFTVIGDGGGANNGSGGTIQNTTAEGILTNSTGTIVLGYLNVSNSGTKGISVTGSTGVTINRCNVTDNAGGATDEGLNLINNTGTITLSDDVVDSAPHNQVNIQNTNTNMTAINATNSTFKCTAGNICQPAGTVGADAMLVQMSGTSVLTSANVQGCTFSGVRSTGLQVSVDTTARIGSSTNGVITAPAASNSFVVQSCTVTNNNAGIDMSKSQSSNLTFQILNNLTITGHKSQPINSQSGAGSGFGGTITGYISGNVIGTQGVKDSGTTLGNGIRLVVQGDSTQGFYTVDGNTIHEVPNGGNGIISLFSQDGVASVSGTGSARFKITNNTLPAPSGTNQSIGCGAGVPCLDSGIFLLADQHNSACALITGNNIFDVTAFPATATSDVYLAERTGPAAGATITVQTGSNGGNSAAALAFINANNTLAGSSKSIDEEGNATTVSSCGSFPP